MEGSVIDLSKYRYQSAVEDLAAAKTLLNAEQYKASVNRSYYALFHALRAVTALDGFDSSKHSGIIAFFNRTYVKEGIFDNSLSNKKAFVTIEKSEISFNQLSKTNGDKSISLYKNEYKKALLNMKNFESVMWNPNIFNF